MNWRPVLVANARKLQGVAVGVQKATREERKIRNVAASKHAADKNEVGRKILNGFRAAF